MKNKLLIVKELTEVIYNLHYLNIYHQDIILDNIIFDGKSIHLIDFGLAVKNSSGISTTRSGKINYFPPEMYENDEYDARSRDIWSLGVVTYMLYSYKPLIIAKYRNEQVKLLSISFIKYLQVYNPSALKWDYKLLDFLSHCFEPDPKKRWTAKHLMEHDFFIEESHTNLFKRLSLWLSPKDKTDYNINKENNNNNVRNKLNTV